MDYEIIRKEFERNRNKEKAEQMSKYMRNKFKFYGLMAEERRGIYKEYLKEERNIKIIDWDFLYESWENEHREFQYLVIDYLKTMRDLLNYEDIEKMEKFIRTKQWWDTIDLLDRIIGSIAFKDDRVNDLMIKWSEDEDFWVRRIAIDHQLNRKEKTNEKLLEEILVNNFGSNEFFINKAIGWSLRNYSKTNPNWVRDFFNRYKDRMDKLSIREEEKQLFKI